MQLLTQSSWARSSPRHRLLLLHGLATSFPSQCSQVSGFNPGEETVLFFSFHRDSYKSTKGVSILQTKFVVPSSGSAAVMVNWQVPWDGRFLQSATATTLGPCSISVHASNHMSKVVHSPEFVVVADPQVDALVQVNTLIYSYSPSFRPIHS